MVPVVAGVTMVTGPEVSTVGTTEGGVENVGTVVQDVDREQWETADGDDGDDSVVVSAVATVCVTLSVTLQFVTDKAPPAV